MELVQETDEARREREVREVLAAIKGPDTRRLVHELAEAAVRGEGIRFDDALKARYGKTSGTAFAGIVGAANKVTRRIAAGISSFGMRPWGVAAGPAGRSRDRGDLAGSTRRRGRRARQTGTIRRHSHYVGDPSVVAWLGWANVVILSADASTPRPAATEYAIRRSSGVGTSPVALLFEIGALN